MDIAWHMPTGVGSGRAERPVTTPGMAVTRATTAPERDYSEQVLLLGRLKSGTARESQRVVHVIPASPDLKHSQEVAARCGERLSSCDVQWLPRFSGMPCERCVMAARH